jgi:hypothetical protein
MNFNSKIKQNFILTNILFRLVFFMLAISMVSTASLAQDSLLIAKIKEEINQKGESEKIKFLKEEKDALEILDFMSTFMKESKKPEKFSTVYMIYGIYRANKDREKIKNRVIDILCTSCNDAVESVSDKAASFLLNFCKNDFTKKQIKHLKKCIATKRSDPDFLLLSGIIGGASQMKELKKSIALQTKGKEEKDIGIYYEHYALARMGDQASIKHCINKITEQKDEDDILVYDTKWFSYIRDEQTIKILVDYLFSDKYTSFTGECIINEKYAQIVIQYFPDAIRSFPVQEKGYYTDEDVAIARKWIIEHPNYKIRR